MRVGSVISIETKSRIFQVSGQNITAALRTRVFSSVTQQETAFFDKNKTGELINRLSADTQLVSQTVTQQVSDGLRSGMMTLAGVGMMFYMSPQVIPLKISRNIVPFSWHLWVWLWYLLSQYGECSWARK